MNALRDILRCEMGGKKPTGVLKPRPGEQAGQECEAPGCKRTESSDWYAKGRACSKRDCKRHFNVKSVDGKPKPALAETTRPRSW